MLHVSEEDVAGQSGTFVTGTPGDGETQISGLATTAINSLCGTKVYRHPSLGFYLRVNFYDSGNGAAQRFARVSYVVGMEVSGGDFTPSRRGDEIWPLGAAVAGSYYSITIIPAVYGPIKASCGADHFWIGDAGGVTCIASGNYSPLPYSASWFGMGVFASLADPQKLLVTTGCEKSSSSAGYSGAADATYGPPAQRYWTYDGAWVYRTPGAAGALTDPAFPSVDAGVRVAPAKLVLGELCAFNFGFVAASTVSDLQELTVDLVGEAQTYVAQRALAPSNVNGPYLPAAAMCCPIYPWAA
jgi:hypothetical protein